MGDLVATPRNYLTGFLADAVGGVNNFASKPFGYNNPPGAMLSGLLGLPAIANTLNEASYGGSLTTGKGMTTRPKADTADAALGLLGLVPVANAGVNAAVRGAQRLEPAINRAVTATMDRGGFPAMALDAMANRTVSPATVWHGSPHKFDKFSIAENVGKGEGKQQQGVGAYLADAQQVGQKYADKEALKRGMDSGYLYKIDLPDEVIANMANHDVPFANQPDKVKDAIAPMFGQQEMAALKGYHGWDNLDDAPFSAVLDSIEIAKGNNRAATSEALRQAGIPGIRYLDGGSRGAGAGTSNYVVFPGNENLLTILERNGQPVNGLLQPTQTVSPAIGSKNVSFPSVSDDLEKWAAKQQLNDLSQFTKVGGSDKFDLYHQPVKTTTRAGYDPSREGQGTMLAVDKNGQIIGSTFYGPWKGDRTANALDGVVEVHPDFRRQGVASAMYDQIENLTGLKMKPAETQTPLAKAFWESRNSQQQPFDPMRRNENDLLAGALPFGALIDQDNRNYLRGLLNP